jgi:hypothetical protein
MLLDNGFILNYYWTGQWKAYGQSKQAKLLYARQYEQFLAKNIPLVAISLHPLLSKPTSGNLPALPVESAPLSLRLLWRISQKEPPLMFGRRHA